LKIESKGIVTIEDNYKYYLADDTIYNGVKYYLANTLDENEDITEQSFFFKERKEGNDIFLDVVEDEEIIKYLFNVFVANTVTELEALEEES